jgi:hypothetical protein
MADADSRVDAYIAAAAPFARPLLEHLRAAVHAGCPDAVETIKWGMPFFIHGGKNMVFMAAFKAHAAFGFVHGSRMVRTGKEGEAMGQFGKLLTLRDLPARGELVAMVKAAVALIDAGVPVPRN